MPECPADRAPAPIPTNAEPVREASAPNASTTRKAPDDSASAAAAAAQAASFVRELGSRGLLRPGSSRRVFLAYLVTLVRATPSSCAGLDASSTRALIVAIAKQISEVDASAGLGGVPAADVAKHAERVVSSLPSAEKASETALEAEYRALLASGVAVTDLRGALESSTSAFTQSPLTPDTSPRKRTAPEKPEALFTPPKRRRVDNVEQPATPRTPARTGASQTPRTPSSTPRTPVRRRADLGSFAKFVLDSPGPAITPSRLQRSGVDALDALAAVASNTPRSPAVKSRSRSRNGTPGSVGVAITAWLERVCEDRCEDVEGLKWSVGLQEMIVDEDWKRICERILRLLSCYGSLRTGMQLQGRKDDVLSVYFATLEAILAREKKRGGDAGGTTFVNKLVRSDNFHACLLSCSLETVAAVNGLSNMSTINAALEAFDLSAYELTKAISSFARHLPECPRVIARHLITCEQRYVESIVWAHDSDLVKYLSERPAKSSAASVISGTVATTKQSNISASDCARQSAKEAKCEDTISEHRVSTRANHSDDQSAAKDQAKTEEENQLALEKETSKPQIDAPRTSNRLSVKDLTLQLYYKKLLYIAQERMLEVLAFLNLHFLAEPVFTIVKHAVWEKWYLLVDRHLDQIILCSIYGVAKVRGQQIKFKTIISHYQNASHLREPTFAPLLPGVFRDISLKNNAPSAPPLPPRQGSDAIVRGDIIKLYNMVFMPTMKPFLLQLSPQRDENISVGAHSTGTTRPHSETGTLADSTSLGRGVKHDPVSMSVLQSPLRSRRAHPSPRRIGNVTVSPMSPRVRPLLSFRHSPSSLLRHCPVQSSMTPISRTLYAFGESPVRPQSFSARPAPLPLSFNRGDERTASIRRTYAEAFSNKPRPADAAGQRQVD